MKTKSSFPMGMILSSIFASTTFALPRSPYRRSKMTTLVADRLTTS
ncbi:MAG: hypothetical protein WA183_07270 [Chthoniobacterales bacterium]